jgi:hypothetical protein
MKPPPSPELLGPYDVLAGLYGPVKHAAQVEPIKGHPELTLRDEANAITVYAFRNTFIEDLHAAGRISDPEMKKLNIQGSAKLAHWLFFRDKCRKAIPRQYFAELDAYLRYTRGWERTALDADAPASDYVACAGCARTGLPNATWKFCPWCGTALPTPPSA